MKYKLRNALLLTALAAAFAPAAVATTWYVEGENGSDGNNCTSATTACKTIGHAISLAASGDSIIVAPATYTENLGINKSLAIVGAGATTTIIDGGGSGHVVGVVGGVQVTLTDITIRHGATSLRGGGVENEGVLTLTRITVTGNIAQQGGGLWNNLGTVTINSSTISGNTAYNPRCRELCFFEGGGIYNLGGLTVNSSTISGNLAGSGGGIFNAYHTVTISQTTFSGNSFENWGGTATISQSTFSGSGIGGIAGGTTSISNSTISGGIGVAGARISLSNSTVSGNTGAGISVLGTTSSKVVLQNSIVANNSGGNCSIRPGGSMISHGHNLSSDATCDFGGWGDQNNIDPMLGPLQNNGGPTQTMALPSGSPAIDAGNPNGCKDNLGNLLKTDQRGQPRHDPEDTRGCDIGAYERQSD